MNYNDPTFWLLFAAVYAAYWRLTHRQQNDVLLVASYVFYGFWDYRFLFLILISTVIDFIGGLGVAGVELPRARRVRLAALLVGSALILCSNVHYAALWQGVAQLDAAAVVAALPRHVRDFIVPLGTAAVTFGYAAILPWLYALPERARRKTFLTISMVANLAILGFFKYCDFFIGSFVDVLHAFGVQNPDVRLLGIILPPGISFYTFQAMSYTIDVYRGEATPTEDLRGFALFVCFFPHLVAGPIMRASTLLPQVIQPRHRRPGDAAEGLLLVLIGIFKKVVVADNLARRRPGPSRHVTFVLLGLLRRRPPLGLPRAGREGRRRGPPRPPPVAQRAHFPPHLPRVHLLPLEHLHSRKGTLLISLQFS